MISKSDIYELLRHPLLLLVVTALISQYLIPHITSRWQNHQKEIELKIGLVSQISESVLNIVMATQFAELGSKSQSQEDFDRAFRAWEIQRAVIGSKIRGYFPEMELAKKWDDFSEIVTEIYALSGTTDLTFREERLYTIRSYFHKSNVDWNTLKNIEMKSGGFQDFQKFMKAWFKLKEVLLERQGELVQQILNSSVAMFT